MRKLPFFVFVFVFVFVLASCRNKECDVPIGATNFSIDPNSAYYHGLNNVGGYMYFTGGHRGVVVVRTSLNSFVAYERTCPEDHSTAVEFMEGWEGTILECPECGSHFMVYSDGVPLEGSATACPLYQYSTIYANGILSVY